MTFTAWHASHAPQARLRMHASGRHDGSVDLLITGCEVSLWLGEQFAICADAYAPGPPFRSYRIHVVSPRVPYRP